MAAEDIPQSVVEAAANPLDEFGVTHPQIGPPAASIARDLLVAALREYERLGYRLVRDDEATVERMAKAYEKATSDYTGSATERHQQHLQGMCAALTAAQDHNVEGTRHGEADAGAGAPSTASREGDAESSPSFPLTAAQGGEDG